MLDAIKHITDDIFSFRKTAHRCIVCVKQSNWVKYVIFRVLPGSATAQVIWGNWGGIVKRLLIAYFIGNISANKISKSIHVHQSYSKPEVGRFLRQGVYVHEHFYERRRPMAVAKVECTLFLRLSAHMSKTPGPICTLLVTLNANLTRKYLLRLF